jgi:hypothetical protein
MMPVGGKLRGGLSCVGLRVDLRAAFDEQMHQLRVPVRGGFVHSPTLAHPQSAGYSSKKRHEKRQCGRPTRESLGLADWLRSCGVTHVALESTGVYWKPVRHILEGSFDLLLVNA